MDFFKKNIFFALAGGVLLIITIAGVVVLLTAYKDASANEAKVKEIKDNLQRFKTTPFALTKENQILAKKNSEVAQEEFEKLLEKLVDRRVKPVVQRYTPLGAKNHIRRVCTKMENQLRGNDINMPTTLRYFSFDPYMQPEALPTAEQIPLLMKHLEVVQELIYLVSNSQVSSLDEFVRTIEMEPIARELYDYISIQLAITGTGTSIRRFLNSLNESEYFFVARTITLRNDATLAQLKGLASGASGSRLLEEGPVRSSRVSGGAPPPTRFDETGLGGDVPPPTPQFLTKEQRLAFPDEVQIKALINLDYLEFHARE